ncbi:unnamed protein product, partial [Ectocarpus sp. 12 AP-2014]
PLDRARAFFRSHFTGWLNAQEGQDIHLAALLEIASLKPDHRKQIETAYIDMFKRLRSFLRGAVEDGSIRDCETTSTTRAMIGATDWLFYWLQQLDRDQVLTTADDAWDILLHGLYKGDRAYVPTALEFSPTDDRPAQGFDREEQHRLKQEAFYKAGTWFFNKKG